MNPAQRSELFRRLAAANPNPHSELEYHNPFQLLLAVLLSAQATDKGVNRVTAPLFKFILTPQDLGDFGVERFEAAIRTLGLFRTKARHACAMAARLVERHGGQVPHDRAALEALPGVGRKTANVVLNIAFGEPTLAVDTHVFRVANRTGLAPGNTPLAVEQGLLQAVPKKYLQNAHHWLILHGRHVCRARLPRCDECSIRSLCLQGGPDVRSEP